MPKFRVELVWRYRKKRGGVILGMTIDAPNSNVAVAQAKARHIKRHPARVFLKATATHADDDA